MSVCQTMLVRVMAHSILIQTYHSFDSDSDKNKLPTIWRRHTRHGRKNNHNHGRPPEIYQGGV